MNQGALTLFRLAGITVRLHYTWFLAFFLIAWSLPRLIYPFGYPGWSELHYWIAGSAAAVLLFGSVLFHEFAHSFMALARGLKVDGITLFVFGGAAVLKSEPRRPSDEFLIAVVGPASSLLLAIVFLLLSALIPRDVPAQPLILQLAFINSGLAIFNLMPGFPLDGGRVFRAIVWYITGSMRKGTTIATIVGQVFAFGLIALGIFFILRGSFVIGIWTIFIGWFLNGAAGANR
ncbi:MAG: site-2 protease family protein, partial [Chloroflexota bacterium]|nr:site-2 protease family protein [Chloroflexota bacterium]